MLANALLGGGNRYGKYKNITPVRNPVKDSVVFGPANYIRPPSTMAGFKRRVMFRARTKRRGRGPIVRYQHRQPKSELKCFDSSFQNTAFLTAGATATVNVPIAGTEVYQRIGRHTYNVSLMFRGVLNALTASVQDQARIIIYYDRQPNGASAPLAAVLQDSNAGAGTSALSNISITNRDRFTILADMQFDLAATLAPLAVISNYSVPDPIRQTYNVKRFIKLRGVDSTYNSANAGNIGDITTGAINILFVSNGNSNQWACGWTTRLRYYD